MALKYVHYARVKSAQRKELNRRSESRRLMSTKKTNKSMTKFSKLEPSENKSNKSNEK